VGKASLLVPPMAGGDVSYIVPNLPDVNAIPYRRERDFRVLNLFSSKITAE
jgi:hypothetical protein